MKRIFAVWVAVMGVGLIGVANYGQEQKKEEMVVTLRSTLLEQLRSTHNNKEWFVDGDTAVAGLTPEQASWRDGKGNHSVGQLLYHLVFWNHRTLARLKGEPESKFSGNNEETFDSFDAKRWSDTVRQYDEVMTELEKLVENANETQLKSWATDLEHIGAHNAYHIGEIVYVRREQGSWDPKKGVS
jgi:uncharacterized damage-inducible protein DinB